LCAGASSSSSSSSSLQRPEQSTAVKPCLGRTDIYRWRRRRRLCAGPTHRPFRSHDGFF
jgi:hypothetical protein